MKAKASFLFGLLWYSKEQDSGKTDKASSTATGFIMPEIKQTPEEKKEPFIYWEHLWM